LWLAVIAGSAVYLAGLMVSDGPRLIAFARSMVDGRATRNA
jgi:hypothetical protein